MKTVCILGRGPSINQLRKHDVSKIDEFIMINNHSKTVSDSILYNKIKNKKNYIMCNIQQAGFIPQVLDNLKIESCVTNRFFPNWDLWQDHKDKQIKHSQGGHLNNLGYLPYISEDEPYFYAWRGPKGRNTPVMKTYNGLPIEHMPEDAEKYLFPVFKDNIICNCCYFATLYALVKLKADKIIYFGVDFYNHIDMKKEWYRDPPQYLTHEWWEMRKKYEGEHMKHLWNEYLSNMFPDRIFEFYTTENLKTDKKNIIVNFVNNT
jgi:hypothetical protein